MSDKPRSDQSESVPSSAGECMVCGHYAEKRYGGMGRYLAMCWACWEKDEVVSDEQEGTR